MASLKELFSRGPQIQDKVHNIQYAVEQVQIWQATPPLFSFFLSPPPPTPHFCPPPQSFFVHILKESQQGVASYMLLYCMGRGLRTVALRAGGALLLVLTSC